MIKKILILSILFFSISLITKGDGISTPNSDEVRQFDKYVEESNAKNSGSKQEIKLAEKEADKEIKQEIKQAKHKASTKKKVKKSKSLPKNKKKSKTKGHKKHGKNK